MDQRWYHDLSAVEALLIPILPVERSSRENFPDAIYIGHPHLRKQNDLPSRQTREVAELQPLGFSSQLKGKRLTDRITEESIRIL
jgi:hypothetical protein